MKRSNLMATSMTALLVISLASILNRVTKVYFFIPENQHLLLRVKIQPDMDSLSSMSSSEEATIQPLCHKTV